MAGIKRTLADHDRCLIKKPWKTFQQPFSEKLGVHHFKSDLNEVLEYFDWSPFFWSWELKGKYPDILTRDKIGEEFKSIQPDYSNFENANAATEGAVYDGDGGLFASDRRANRVGDIITVTLEETLATLPLGPETTTLVMFTLLSSKTSPKKLNGILRTLSFSSARIKSPSISTKTTLITPS